MPLKAPKTTLRMLGIIISISKDEQINVNIKIQYRIFVYVFVDGQASQVFLVSISCWPIRLFLVLCHIEIS